MTGLRAAIDELLDRTVLFGYDRIGYQIRRSGWSNLDQAEDLTGKVYLVTGANSGLGFAAARELSRRGARVRLVCRNAERAAAAAEQIRGQNPGALLHTDLADLAEPAAVRALAERVLGEESRLDGLVNNAGVLLHERSENSAGVERTFATNCLAYFLLGNLLAPLLAQTPEARVINVSSGGMYLARLNADDPQFKERTYDGLQAYAETKRAEVALAAVWSQTPKFGAYAWSMHPGWADTAAVQQSLPGFRALMQWTLRSAEEGADTIVWLAAMKDAARLDNGAFYFDRKARRTHRLQRTRTSAAEIRRLWELCADLAHYDGPIQPDEAAFEFAARQA